MIQKKISSRKMQETNQKNSLVRAITIGVRVNGKERRKTTWKVIEDNQSSEYLEILSFNSIFIHKKHQNYLIYTNFFNEIFNKNNPYSETLYFKNPTITPNKMYSKNNQKTFIFPNHKTVTLSIYLQELYTIYLNTEKEHNIFYYDTDQTSIKRINQQNSDWIQNKEAIKQFQDQHEKNSIIVIYINRQNSNKNLKQGIKIYTQQNNQAKQFILKINTQENKPKIKNSNSLSTTENQAIILFHGLLNAQEPQQFLEKKLSSALDQLKKQSNQFNQKIDQIKQFSFTREYPYQKYYFQGEIHQDTNHPYQIKIQHQSIQGNQQQKYKNKQLLKVNRPKEMSDMQNSGNSKSYIPEKRNQIKQPNKYNDYSANLQKNNTENAVNFKNKESFKQKKQQQGISDNMKNSGNSKSYIPEKKSQIKYLNKANDNQVYLKNKQSFKQKKQQKEMSDNMKNGDHLKPYIVEKRSQTKYLNKANYNQAIDGPTINKQYYNYNVKPNQPIKKTEIANQKGNRNELFNASNDLRSLKQK